MTSYGPTRTFVMLIGLPGVGKHTVAKELAPVMPARIFDNESINKPIYHLVDPNILASGDKASFSHDLWQRKFNVRAAMLDILVHHGQPGLSYVFTNVLYKGLCRDLQTYRLMWQTAEKCNARFVPATLTCAPEEHLDRIGSVERQQSGKLIDTRLMKRRLAEGLTPFSSIHPNQLDLDTTGQPAEQIALQIVNHLRRHDLV